MERSLEEPLLEIVVRVADHARVEDLYLGLDVQLLREGAQLFQELGLVEEHIAVGPVHGARVI